MDGQGTQSWLRFLAASMAWTAGLAPALSTLSTLGGEDPFGLANAETWAVASYFLLVPLIMAYGAFRAIHRLVFAGFLLVAMPVVALADSLGSAAVSLGAAAALLAVFLSVAAYEVGQSSS